MIITCPTCSTRYRIDPASLGSKGRGVRCSGCGNRWFVAPPDPRPGPEPRPAPTPAPPPVDVDAEEPPPTPLAAPPPVAAGAPPARRAGAAAGIAGWLLVALLVLLLAAGVVGRDVVVAALPAAQPVYDRLGLPVTVRLGLEFRDLASSRQGGDVGGGEGGGAAAAPGGGAALVVSGEVRNVSGRDRLVPKLRVAFLDERRAEIEAGLFDAPQRSLPPGGATRFELHLANPPADARNFSVSFADRP